MSTPQSVIKICSNVRLNHSYEHTIYFGTLAEQRNYFAGKVVKSFSAYTFLRKSWNVKVAATMDEARTWNYLFFTNTGAKTYYYFITNIEYVNDNTVELSLKMDVLQTYHFDYQLLDSFVEREHALYDNIGDNLLDEGLELGEFVVNKKYNMSELNDLCVLIMTTVEPNNTNADGTTIIAGSNVGRVFSGLGVVAASMDNWSALASKLQELDTLGLSDGIITMWMYPKALVGLASGYSWDDDNVTKRVASNRTETVQEPIFMNHEIDGYEPKNNKLYTHPYNFLYVTNNDGGCATYHYERFQSGQCNLNVCGAISPDAQMKLYPLNYNGDAMNYDEGLMGQKFPTCAWNQDAYKLWLAQNQSQQTLSLVSGGLMVAGGVIGGAMTAGTGIGAAAGFGTALSGLNQIASTLAQRKDMSVQPPQAKGQHSANVNVAQEYGTFTILQKSIDAYHAEMIDHFFDLYGYKTSLVKQPNRYVRENWTYTKTIGCHIAGNLCTEDLVEIESIYNKGVTFWKNGDSIGDYSLSNKPLSIA